MDFINIRATTNFSLDTEENRLKRRSRRIMTERLVATMFAKTVVFSTLLIVSLLILFIYTYSTKYTDLKNTLANESHDKMVIEHSYAEYKEINENLTKELGQKNSEIVVLKYEESQMKNTINDLQDEIDKLKGDCADVDLLKKYEFCMYYGGHRTDIGLKEIEQIESFCKSKGLSEDAPVLILALIMEESRGDKLAKNPESTATGFGQVLASTGYSVWTKVMGNDASTWNNDMLLDGETNITIMMEYLNYLYNEFPSSNMASLVDNYRGGHNGGYNSEVEAWMNMVGSSLNNSFK